MIGTTTILKVERKRLTAGTAINCPAKIDNNKGSIIGARSVERISIETSKATSPPDKKAITLEEVPLGQEPTKMTPAAVAPVK